MFDSWKRNWKTQSAVQGSGNPETNAPGSSISLSEAPRNGKIRKLDDYLGDPSSLNEAENVRNDRQPQRRKLSDGDSISNKEEPQSTSATEEEVTPEATLVYPFNLQSIKAEVYQRDVTTQGLRENTIVIVRDESVKPTFPLPLLLAFKDIESRRASEGASKRVSILLMPPGSNINQRASILSRPGRHDRGSRLNAVACPGESSGDPGWSTMLNKDLLVMTAETFTMFLSKGGASLLHVNLLLLDSVHDVKEDHPFAKLLDKHYTTLAPDERPRLFSLSAATNHPRGFDKTLLGIEELIHSRVFGVMPKIRDSVTAEVARSQDVVLWYHKEPYQRATKLTKVLREQDPNGTYFPKQFASAKHVSPDLGQCASDLVWQRYLTKLKEEPHATSMTPRSVSVNSDDDSVNKLLPKEIKEKVQDILSNYRWMSPKLTGSSRSKNVSRKFCKLLEVLGCFEPEQDTFRGLIYVKRQCTAYAMLDLMKSLNAEEAKHLRPQVLVGPITSDHDQALGQDDDAIRTTISDFRSGKFNVLIVNSFAEDCIELPLASCVVRWDLFDNFTSYAHSKAHARPSHSHFIIMVQRGEDETTDRHRRIIRGLSKLDDNCWKWIQAVPTERRSIPPPEMLRADDFAGAEGVDDYDDVLEDYIREPIIGARIYSHNAVVAIYRYAASVVSLNPALSYFPEPLFEYFSSNTSQPPLFTCTVNLPSGPPLTEFTGPARRSRADARRWACFGACQQLFRLRLLDLEHFPRPLPQLLVQTPSPTTQAQEENNEGKIAEGAEKTEGPAKATSSGTQCYPKQRVAFWKNSLTAHPGCLYPTVITIERTFENSAPALDDAHSFYAGPFRPICILARQPLPAIPPFKIFVPGISLVVHLRRCVDLNVNDEQMRSIHRYTRRVYRSIANRLYDCEEGKAGCLLAPLRRSWRMENTSQESTWRFPSVANYIQWDEVRQASGSEDGLLSIQGRSLEELTMELQDAVIQDRWLELAPRYEFIKLREDLGPLSKPEDSAREAGYENLLDYYTDKTKTFQSIEDLDQPIVEVARVPTISNMLSPSRKTEAVQTGAFAKYLIPELCKKLVIPASVMRTALLIPSIHRRIDDILITKEINTILLDNRIEEPLLHSALSCPSAGMECDYERLELLGDAFLKYVSSIYVFVTHPSEPEGFLHGSRQKIISNKALFKVAVDANLPAYIQSMSLTVKRWLPPGFTVPSERRLKEGPKERRRYRDMESTVLQTPPEEQATELPFVRSGLAVGGSSQHDQSGLDDTDLDIESGPAEPSPPPVPPSPSPQASAGRVNDLRRQGSHKNSLKNVQHWLGDKSLADVTESIIGAAFLTAEATHKTSYGKEIRGRDHALRICRTLKVAMPGVDHWADLSKKMQVLPEVQAMSVDQTVLEGVQKIIGWSFKRPCMLAQALNHEPKSKIKQPIMSYERLEFLGDAILDFFVIQDIYHAHPTLTPGEITSLKGSMVSNRTLAALCVHSGLCEYLRYDSPALERSIKEYKANLSNSLQRETEIAQSQSRNVGQYWAEFEPPKELSDVIESIMGAILVSDDLEPEGAEHIYNTLIKPFLEPHIDLATILHHPNKILVERFQSYGCQDFSFMNHPQAPDGFVRCEVLCHDVVLTSERDRTTSQASRRASLAALAALDGDPEFMKKTCDCRARTEAKRAAKRARKAEKRSSGPHQIGFKGSPANMDEVMQDSDDFGSSQR